MYVLSKPSRVFTFLHKFIEELCFGFYPFTNNSSRLYLHINSKQMAGLLLLENDVYDKLNILMGATKLLHGSRRKACFSLLRSYGHIFQKNKIMTYIYIYSSWNMSELTILVPDSNLSSIYLFLFVDT